MPTGTYSFNPLTQFCSSVPTLPMKNSKIKELTFTLKRRLQIQTGGQITKLQILFFHTQHLFQLHIMEFEATAYELKCNMVGTL